LIYHLACSQVLREVKVFGDAELATLRRDIQQHKAQLEQLKATRLEQQQREEALALHEMRKAVELLQKMDGALADADERVSCRLLVLGLPACMGWQCCSWPAL
jgi:exonuclease III